MNRFSDIDNSSQRLPPVYGYHSEQIVSIEQALESIESEIVELARYIKLAQRYCHYPSEHGLSRDQSAAIYIYTMEWGDTTLYRLLNQALRSENRQALKIWFPYLKLFNTALDMLPTVKDNLWRGVSLDIGKHFTKNQLITWWSVNSCSSSVDLIKSFLGNKKNATFFLIEALNGKKISGYTAYENEDEVILRMGTQLCVKSNPLDHPDGSHLVHLIEIDDEALTSPMNELHLTAKSSNKEASGQLFSSPINSNTKWKQNGITIAGGNGQGNQLNQLHWPYGLYVDDDNQCIYIADCYNHRIVQWKLNASHGQIVAGGNGEGNRMNQLNYPTDVIVDPNNDSLIIADQENRRVIQWSRRNNNDQQILISNINCSRLTMDQNGDLYVSDWVKHDVRRWKRGAKNGILVAGGNGQGNHFNQLNLPTSICVDEDYSIYISDNNNHRVMKWLKGAKEGIVVAGGGGQSKGHSLSQLSHPQGLIVDHLGYIYVADGRNHRIMRWSKDSKEVIIVVGGNGDGDKSNQFNRLGGLAFDRNGNLYVVDNRNNRVQKFDRNHVHS